MAEDLTSLKRAKAWVLQAGSKDITTDDDVLRRLISAVSCFILGQLQRPTLRLNTYSVILDGSGSGQQMLPYFPVIDVSSVQSGSINVPAAQSMTDTGFSWPVWDGYPPGKMQSLFWRGGSFCRGQQNVAVTFRSGYYVANEPQVASTSVQVNETLGEWLADEGVTMNGVVMTPTTGTPTTGQYKLGPEPGSYVFSADDASTPVLISYSYVPSDLAQACREIVAERYSYKDRVGQTSKVLGQETVSFSLKDMPDWAATTLQPYKRVVFV